MNICGQKELQEGEYYWQELSPALVREGGEDVEAVTVDINVKKMQIVCTSAYGP